jgi:hypothetical protein
MAEQGYRLVKTSFLTYTFEACKPSEYIYRVEVIYDKTRKQQKDYQIFLKNLGIRTITKNYGTGQLAFGKAKLSAFGKIRTSPGAVNKELLILEKKNNGEPFEVYTVKEDKIRYYGKLLYSFLIFAGFLLLMAIFGRARLGFIENALIVKLIESIARGFAVIICIPVLFTVIKVFLRIRELKQENTIE